MGKATANLRKKRRATGPEFEETRMLEGVQIPNHLPIMPLLSVVVFPGSVLSFIVRKPHNIQLLSEIDDGERIICLVGQQGGDPDTTPKNLKDLYPIGVASRLIHAMNLPDGSVQVTFQGLARVAMSKILQKKPYLRGEVRKVEVESVETDNIETSALMATAMNLFEKLVAMNPSYSNELTMILKMNVDGVGRFTDLLATFVNFPLAKKHELLAELNKLDRLKRLIDALQEEINKAQVEQDVNESVKSEIEKSQREYILRQHLNAIRKELGEGDDAESEVERLKELLAKKNLPENAHAKADEQIRRLGLINSASAEYNVVRTYIEWLLDLPWTELSDDNLNLKNARKVLDDGHYGLDEVKDRIIEFLAVMKLRGEAGGTILCLQGPPGVGKTSLGKGVAEALGRKFERISVGGLRDDSEIMGHRRTYVGAMPGKIIAAMKHAGTKNPIIMIDEIDKMGSDFRGDPASAMLEVLDPSQNSTFQDRYMEVPFDLSKVFFICTSNQLDTIPRPLLDRMEVIQLSGYTQREKFEIAKRHLIARQLDATGLKPSNVKINDEALNKLIVGYTREAGVRNLERTIGQAFRKVAIKIASSGKSRSASITARNLKNYLGAPKIVKDPRLANPTVGVATGLAWTAVGGEILFIEATKYPGKGGLKVTGMLGDVMKESTQAALSYVRTNAEALKIDRKVFEEEDIHIHFPEGATPKDGPSAGVTIVCALVSLLTDRPVKADIAMTGEVTLHGRVLAVGGIKEKVLAAHRAGITTVLLPEACKKDLEDIPEEVRDGITILFSSDVKTNIKKALG